MRRSGLQNHLNLEARKNSYRHFDFKRNKICMNVKSLALKSIFFTHTLTRSTPKINNINFPAHLLQNMCGSSTLAKIAFNRTTGREGNEKKNIPKTRERESKAIIPGNGWEREWNKKITMIRTD